MRNQTATPTTPRAATKGAKDMHGKPWRELKLRAGDKVSVQIARDWWGFALGRIDLVRADGVPHFMPDNPGWGARYLTFERVVVLGTVDMSGVIR